MIVLSDECYERVMEEEEREKNKNHPIQSLENWKL